MKLGISCRAIVSELGYEKAFELCKESGFDAVDFGLELYGDQNDPSDIYNAPEEAFVAHFTAIRKKAESLGLIISQTHGRCITYTPDEKQCAYARWVSDKDLHATALLGAPACVIHHLTGGRWPDHFDDGEFMIRKCLELYDYLIPVAEKYGVCVAMETFGRAVVYGKSYSDYFGDVRNLKKLYDMLDTKNKVLCMDTGHTHEVTPFGTPSVEESIRILGSDIKLLHLHDNNSTYDQHLPPIIVGKNLVNWPAVFDALDEIGFDGVYNFELILRQFTGVMPEAIKFLGIYLRNFIEKRGRIG